ncbi:DUF488 domain-containing protein [Caldimonas sp. KR1-144]|uniref:DUF488 domain-containing protein n=1 Tax=Caldimonas sp. KR1-144 TaxID=3400911 RepID=UPI003C0041D4
MAIRVVRLGTPRAADEGPRLGTVRRPPRGVPKSEFASGNWYDVWLPALSPSTELMAEGRDAATDAQWAAFERKLRTELKRPNASQLLDTLAALSHTANFSLGCYCENEARCHRSVLRKLLAERQAQLD